jgi:hypothetical protein
LTDLGEIDKFVKEQADKAAVLYRLERPAAMLLTVGAVCADLATRKQTDAAN